MAEFEDRFLACLADAGVGLTPATDGGGGFEIDWGAMGEEAFYELEEECRTTIGEPRRSPRKKPVGSTT